MRRSTPGFSAVLALSTWLLLPFVTGGCRRTEPAPVTGAARPEESLEALAARARQLPGDPAPAARYARRLLDAGREKEALATLRQLLQRHPGFAEGWNDLGMIQVMAGDARGARRSWERAAKLDPKLVSTRCNLALLLVRQGKLEEALRRYEEIAADAPGDPAGWKGLGDAALRNGSPSRARQAFEAALRLRPDDTVLWLGLAEALYQLKDYGAARAAAARGRDLDADDARVRLIHALATAEDETSSDGLEAASRDLKALLDTPEHRAIVAYGLGRISLREGKPGDAVVYTRLALEGDPANMQARYQLARALLSSGRREEGRRAMETYHRLFEATGEVAALRLRARRHPTDTALHARLKGAEARQAALFATH